MIFPADAIDFAPFLALNHKLPPTVWTAVSFLAYDFGLVYGDKTPHKID